MQIRTKLLTAAIAGASCVALQGVGNTNIYAAGAPPEPVDEYPGVITINKINPGANSVTVTYEDTGTDVDKIVRFNLSFINDGRDFPASSWVQIMYPVWMTTLYDKMPTEDNSAQLLSGQTETITADQMKAGARLLDNDAGKLYYGGAALMEGNDNALRYIMGVVDYSGCMSVYQDGVECIAEQNAAGEVIYAPYLNGVRLQMPGEEENTGGGGDNSGNNEDNGDSGNGNSGENTSGEGTGDNSGGGAGNEDAGNTSGEGSNSGSGNDSSGSGSGSSNDHWSGSSDSSAGNDPVYTSEASASAWDLGYANYYYFAAADDTLAVASDDAGSADSEAADSDSKKGTAADSAGAVNVPELSQDAPADQPGGLRWWVIAPLAAAACGLAAWWFIPFWKKRRSRNSDE